jgi:ribosomal-protein-alanine N-acetyltransferase
MSESAVAREFPILSTDRLLMRTVSMDDVSSIRALLGIAEVTRYSNIPDLPTEEQIIELARNMSELYQSGNGCAWIIEDRLSHAFVGVFRFNWFHKPWKCGGIGYELHPSFWGRGVMTEALRAAIRCGHDMFGLNRIEAWTLPGNGASDRVLEKCGFRYEGTLRQKAWFKGAFHDFRMFGRVTDDALRE